MAESKLHPAAPYFVEALYETTCVVACMTAGDARGAIAHSKAAVAWLAALSFAYAAVAVAEYRAGPAAPIVREVMREMIARDIAPHVAQREAWTAEAEAAEEAN